MKGQISLLRGETTGFAIHPFRNPRAVLRLIKAFSREGPQYRAGRAALYLSPDRSKEPFEVFVEPQAVQWLSRNRERSAGLPKPSKRIDVWFDLSDRLPVRVMVHVRKRLIGALDSEGERTFLERVESAQRNHYVLMASGYCNPGPDGVRFFIYAPS
jgi:hypothetical protein